jgi:hypothetical protein
MTTYTVTEGDDFDSIAKANSFFDYQTVYKQGSNKTNWPNPNMLVAGGTVDIPDKEVKKADLKLDATVKVVIVKKKTKFRVVLVDSSFASFTIDSCGTTIGINYTQKPNAKGLLDLADIDPAIKDGKITATRTVAPAPAAPVTPAAAVNPKAYPIVIVPADFKDTVAKAEAPSPLEWTLKIGSLEPHTTIRGVLQRLVNLGFGAPVQTTEDATTARMVSAYQLNIQAKTKGQETGKIADIRDDVKHRHDTI